MKALLAGFLLVTSVMIFPAITLAEKGGLFTDQGITVSGDMSYLSEYVWRGFLLDGDSVVQPGVYLSWPTKKTGTLTAKFWSNHDLEDSDSRKSEEYDYILDYTYSFEELSLSFGHTYYDFPGVDGFTREFYAGVGFPKLILAPSVFIYRDYGKHEAGGGEGTYTVINAAYSMPVELAGYGCSLDFSGHWGYNHELFINGKGADLGLSAGFSIPLTKAMTLVPSINYSSPFKDLKEETNGNQRDRFFTGITMKYTL